MNNNSALQPYSIISGLFLSLLTGFWTQAFADTAQLPAGAHAFVYKHIEANIPISYDQNGKASDFSVKEVLGAPIIRSLSPQVASAYQELRRVDSGLADNLDLGKIDLTPTIQAKGEALGLAWGVSDRLMLAVGVPFLRASVTLSGGYYNSGAISKAAKELRKTSEPKTKTKALALAQLLEQLPMIRGEYLQGVLVNNWGYKPIGNWKGSGIGDTKIFAQFKAHSDSFIQNALRLGTELPTGHVDDPDNLIDLPFGAGYYKTYLESQNDLTLWPDHLILNFRGRYQYGWSTERTFRLKPSSSFPLTAEKELIQYKPGNTWNLGTELHAKLTHSITLMSAFTRTLSEQDHIRGNRADYDYSILETGTDSEVNTLEFGIRYSSVNSYLAKEIPIPFLLGLTFSRVLSGTNTEQINQSEIHLEMYF